MFWRGNSKSYDTYWHLSLRWSVNVFRFFESWWKSTQKDIKCLIENKEGQYTQRDREAVALYISKYCLGVWQIFFGTILKKVSFLARAFVPPWGRGEIFLGKPGDFLHFRTFFKVVIHIRYTDFQLIFISKCDEFCVVFQKPPWEMGSFKISKPNVFFEKPLGKWVISKFSKSSWFFPEIHWSVKNYTLINGVPQCASTWIR